MYNNCLLPFSLYFPSISKLITHHFKQSNPPTKLFLTHGFFLIFMKMYVFSRLTSKKGCDKIMAQVNIIVTFVVYFLIKIKKKNKKRKIHLMKKMSFVYIVDSIYIIRSKVCAWVYSTYEHRIMLLKQNVIAEYEAWDIIWNSNFNQVKYVHLPKNYREK